MKEGKQDLSRGPFYLVSYPKSGNTWMRFLLGHYLTNGMINFSNYHKVIPDIHRNPEDIPEVKYSPVFIKSHFAFNDEYKSIIYLYRDGRDVSVSYYYHLLGKSRIPAETSFGDFFWKFFIKGKVHFGDWGEHLLSWMKLLDTNSDVMILSYESLQENTEDGLRKVLDFSGIEIDETRLGKAIMHSTKENMIADEIVNRENSLEHKGVTSKEFRFVRKGIVGEWMTLYDSKMLDAFYEKYGTIMTQLGYDTNIRLK